jgi:hypothetical protein
MFLIAHVAMGMVTSQLNLFVIYCNCLEYYSVLK